MKYAPELIGAVLGTIIGAVAGVWLAVAPMTDKIDAVTEQIRQMTSDLERGAALQ